MEKNKQTQTAGDNAQQIQAGTINIYQGITEQRAYEIVNAKSREIIESYIDEAKAESSKRMEEFAQTLLPKVEKVESDFESFKNVGFLNDLSLAQRNAACTDSKSDYELLSELLTERIKSKEDRKKLLSIRKAIEIVTQIDEEALCAITAIYSITNFCTYGINKVSQLNALENLYGSLLYTSLPETFEWIDHLELLNTIRVDNSKTFKSFEDFIFQKFSGFCEAGIKTDSEDYKKATTLLEQYNIPLTVFLEENGYVTLSVGNRKNLALIMAPYSTSTGFSIYKPRNQKEIQVLEQVYDMYSNDANLKKQKKDSFIEELKTYKNITVIQEWWNLLPKYFEITSVGRVLAHSNAEKYSKLIPKFDE